MKTKHVTTLTTILVAILAALSFTLSYASLQHMAAANGVEGWLSYVWPLLLDFAMVVFAAAILRVNLRNDEGSLYPWALTVVFAGLATLSNVLDVSTFGIPAVFVQVGVKALPPVALALSFHLLMEMIKREASRSKLDASIDDLDARRQQLTEQVDALDVSIDQKANRVNALRVDIKELSKVKRASSLGNLADANGARADGKQNAMNALVDYLAVNPNASLAEAGEAIDRSKTTVASYMTELEEAGRIDRNGNGSASTIDPPS